MQPASQSMPRHPCNSRPPKPGWEDVSSANNQEEEAVTAAQRGRRGRRRARQGRLPALALAIKHLDAAAHTGGSRLAWLKMVVRLSSCQQPAPGLRLGPLPRPGPGRRSPPGARDCWIAAAAAHRPPDRALFVSANPPAPLQPSDSCTLPYPDRFTEATAFVAQREKSPSLGWAPPPLSCCPCRPAGLACDPCLAHLLLPPVADGGGLTEESKLLLYSLHQQATVVRPLGARHRRSGRLVLWPTALHASCCCCCVQPFSPPSAACAPPPAPPAGPLQRAQALGLERGQQRKVAVVEAAGRHGRR